ncbi:protein quiver-like [Dreissena polymorpha]|uniref:Uncharacterized protein n=1 Tax=Dreissena polymorpha TaxID=45954 RepID=A0A9D4HFX0_DREPO|nr:protein quiver-like [Dreissena polymorpha]KAH3716104.1 hypothetical protein DPMN_058821 [Dreissena polymorpha]
MVGTNTFLFACALAALLCVSNVDAFKCYVCSSVTDSGCSDKFHKSYTLESSSATCDSCIKTKKKDSVIRTCAPVDFGNTCQSSGDDGAFCSCHSELCNGSNNMAVSMATLLGATLVVLFSNI